MLFKRSHYSVWTPLLNQFHILFGQGTFGCVDCCGYNSILKLTFMDFSKNWPGLLLGCFWRQQRTTAFGSTNVIKKRPISFRSLNSWTLDKMGPGHFWEVFQCSNELPLSAVQNLKKNCKIWFRRLISRTFHRKGPGYFCGDFSMQ